MLNRDPIQFGIFNKLLRVDESIIPYFGRHSAKMFIKPICFDFKILCLCDNDGYPYNIKIYQGKEKELQDQTLGSRVINNMVDNENNVPPAQLQKTPVNRKGILAAVLIC